MKYGGGSVGRPVDWIELGQHKSLQSHCASSNHVSKVKYTLTCVARRNREV